MNNMNTFPQIFLENDSKKLIKIGGYTETMTLLSNIFEKKSIDFSEDDAQSLKNFFNNKK
jgi:hypothetical protein